MEWIASAAFGLEGLVARDLKRLGIEKPAPQPTGGVRFEADFAQAFAANLWLRTADRVLMVCGRFEALSFEALFQGVKALPWEKWIPQNGRFPVRAHCARSRLMSPSDCQSIAKKAIVERLKSAHKRDWFPESGENYQIDLSIQRDVATICLDSSGPALNKRGYRTFNGEAPLRETMAAALLLISPWRARMPLYDPCCGTGTILIEAAYIALNRAPGLTRAFDCEQWGFMPKARMEEIRREAEKAYEMGARRPLWVSGSDTDPEALKLARRHIAQAGLEGRIRLEQRDVRQVELSGGPGVILTNPPYGERLGDKKAAQAVCRALRALQDRSPGWALCAISSDAGFEKTYGRRAKARHRLYNGRLECDFLTYEGSGSTHD